MDGKRFDELTRFLAVSPSRRAIVRGFAVAGLGALQIRRPSRAQPGCTPLGQACSLDRDCCSGSCSLNTNTCVCPPGTGYAGPPCGPSRDCCRRPGCVVETACPGECRPDAPCPEHFTRCGGRCVPDCPAGRVMGRDCRCGECALLCPGETDPVTCQCLCPPGTEACQPRSGAVFLDSCLELCPSGETRDPETCECVPCQLECAPGEELDPAACRCRCAPDATDCGDGRCVGPCTGDASFDPAACACVCPPGLLWCGERGCISLEDLDTARECMDARGCYTRRECLAGQTWDWDRCGCVCVPCPANARQDPVSCACECLDGTERCGDSCVPSCPAGEGLDRRSCECVTCTNRCPEGAAYGRNCACVCPSGQPPCYIKGVQDWVCCADLETCNPEAGLCCAPGMQACGTVCCVRAAETCCQGHNRCCESLGCVCRGCPDCSRAPGDATRC